MECFVCGKTTKEAYLCKDHAKELKHMLDSRQGVVDKPEWKHHCAICGEFEKRTIIEYPSFGYFCDRDIIEEWEKALTID